MTVRPVEATLQYNEKSNKPHDILKCFTIIILLRKWPFLSYFSTHAPDKNAFANKQRLKLRIFLVNRRVIDIIRDRTALGRACATFTRAREACVTMKPTGRARGHNDFSRHIRVRIEIFARTRERSVQKRHFFPVACEHVPMTKLSLPGVFF